MKKRILAPVLAALLVLSLAVPTLAEPITSAGSGTATLTYEVSSTYSVTIPESVSLTKSGDTISGTGTLTVAAGTLLDFGKELTVKVRGLNYDAVAGFRLKNGTNEEYLNYDLKYGTSTPGTKAVANDIEILSVLAGTTDQTGCSLWYTVTSEVTKAGSFTDTLTFTIAVGDA